MCLPWRCFLHCFPPSWSCMLGQEEKEESYCSSSNRRNLSPVWSTFWLITTPLLNSNCLSSVCIYSLKQSYWLEHTYQ
ncbi:hypothetical protein Lalb_Chr10g0102611 [Lupinus albus]|uniref:Uncharacterized protein n=1 Tax=Lupinus albus TaxID=3870 RepID=A0A6A4PW90_LUPAL|nr:hypothetical protein Lalb_Chr10g0102611 [Lupinus albus]